MNRLSILATCATCATCAAFGMTATANAAPLSYDVLGDPRDVVTTTQPGLLLAGGGDAVDSAYVQFLNMAAAGDVVVLQTSAGNSWARYFFDLAPVDSVETLAPRTAAQASDPFWAERIAAAEAIFIAGGDQSEYVRAWRDTPVATAISEAAARGVPVGGTSAGLAILGEYAFTAENGTVYSDEVLRNPYNRYVTLGDGFLAIPTLASVITDSHFTQRQRMGRLVGFVARIIEDGWDQQPRGIGVDENNIVLIDGDGVASLHGNGGAYFVTAPGPAQRCTPRRPLRYLDVPVTRISGAATFNLSTWTGTGGQQFTVSAARGALSP